MYFAKRKKRGNSILLVTFTLNPEFDVKGFFSNKMSSIKALVIPSSKARLVFKTSTDDAEIEEEIYKHLHIIEKVRIVVIDSALPKKLRTRIIKQAEKEMIRYVEM